MYRVKFNFGARGYFFTEWYYDLRDVRAFIEASGAWWVEGPQILGGEVSEADDVSATPDAIVDWPEGEDGALQTFLDRLERAAELEVKA